VGRADIDTLRTFGYTDEQIMEAVVVVGFAKFANYIAFGLGTLPDFDASKIPFASNHAAR
jgi:alkylhydroperoxidase family enzyme